MQLVEGLGLHEHVLFAVLVQVLIGLVLDKGLSTLSVVRRRSTVFTPSLMRRISRWVTGVPLPGWMFSAVITR